MTRGQCRSEYTISNRQTWWLFYGLSVVLDQNCLLHPTKLTTHTHTDMRRKKQFRYIVFTFVYINYPKRMFIGIKFARATFEYKLNFVVSIRS